MSTVSPWLAAPTTNSPNKAGPPAKLKNGQTEWIPPPHLDHGQPSINTHHHPEKLLRDHEDDETP
jgi:hypothetical protein